MIVYAVQWHSLPLPPHADEEDLAWTTWPGHEDYLDEGEADEAAREFDAAFDGAYIHRVTARHVSGPSVVRTRGLEVPPAKTALDDPPAALADARARAARRG